MNNGKKYYILGGILCFIAAVYAAVALTHPELSFPWKNWATYTIYALYGIYTVLIFMMPKFERASLIACGVLATLFAALAFVIMSIGSHSTEGGTNNYLTIGIILTCIANSTNLILLIRSNKSK